MDHVTLANDQFTAKILLKGAELCSLQRKSDTEEYIWQNETNVWPGHAPILFPIVGKIKNDRYRYKGNLYSMAKHGFARNEEFRLEHESLDSGRYPSSCNLVLSETPQTLASYPFEFRLTICFTLTTSGIAVRYDLENRGTNTLIFGLGSHPGFRVPGFPLNGNFAVVFEKEEGSSPYRLVGGLLTEEPSSIKVVAQKLEITKETFADDALIFRNIQSRSLKLLDISGRERLSFSWTGAPHMGLWAKPGAPYICFEPWFGHDDMPDTSEEFEQKAQLERLGPGKIFSTGYAIRASQGTVVSNATP